MRHAGCFFERQDRPFGSDHYHPDLATFASITDAICNDDSVPRNDRIEGAPARPDGTHYEGDGEVVAASLLADLISPMMLPR